MLRQRYSVVERIKDAVRERDGQRCTRCGRTKEESIARWGSQLQVHRTTPGSLYSAAPGVCVTLCLACHAGHPVTPHVRLMRLKNGERRRVFVRPGKDRPPLSISLDVLAECVNQTPSLPEE